MSRSYDTACLTLAEHFLGTIRTKGEDDSLAQAIQHAVEDWFANRGRHNEPCLSPAEQKVQGARCGCRGADDYCVCQNVPDATTRTERAAK